MKYFVLIVVCLLMGCNQKKKYHDEIPSKSEVPVKSNGIAGVLAFQKELNEEFKNPETSPLPDRYRKDFEGLEFFAPDTTYIVKARFERTPNALPFMMPTTTGRKSEEVVYGIVHFSLNGKNHRLELYQNSELTTKEGFEDYLFLPFTDETNGEETYAGGRYIDMTIPLNNIIEIDFNKAYNPYCAYNKKYSCPLVPAVNHISTKVLAGVKAFNE